MGSNIQFSLHEVPGWVRNALYISQDNKEFDKVEESCKGACVNTYGKILGSFLWCFNIATWKEVKGNYYYLSKSSYQEWLSKVSAAHLIHKEITLQNISKLSSQVKQYNIDATNSLEDDIQQVFEMDNEDYQTKFFSEPVSQNEMISKVVQWMIDAPEGLDVQIMLYKIIKKWAWDENMLDQFCQYLLDKRLNSFPRSFQSSCNILYHKLLENPQFKQTIQRLEKIDQKKLENSLNELINQFNEGSSKLPNNAEYLTKVGKLKNTFTESIKQITIDHIFTSPFGELNSKDLIQVAIKAIPDDVQKKIMVDERTLLNELTKRMVNEINSGKFALFYEKLRADDLVPEVQIFLKQIVGDLENEFRDLRLSLTELQKKIEGKKYLESVPSDVAYEDYLKSFNDHLGNEMKTFNEKHILRKKFIDDIEKMTIGFILDHFSTMNINNFLTSTIERINNVTKISLNKDVILQKLTEQMINELDRQKLRLLYEKLQLEYEAMFSKDFQTFLKDWDLVYFERETNMMTKLGQKFSSLLNIISYLEINSLEKEITAIIKTIKELSIDYSNKKSSYPSPISEDEQKFVRELYDLIVLIHIRNAKGNIFPPEDFITMENLSRENQLILRLAIMTGKNTKNEIAEIRAWVTNIEKEKVFDFFYWLPTQFVPNQSLDTLYSAFLQNHD